MKFQDDEPSSHYLEILPTVLTTLQTLAQEARSLTVTTPRSSCSSTSNPLCLHFRPRRLINSFCFVPSSNSSKKGQDDLFSAMVLFRRAEILRPSDDVISMVIVRET